MEAPDTTPHAPLAPNAPETPHDRRLDLIRRAIRLEPVDHIPVIYMGLAFAPLWTGMPLSRYCTDADAALAANLDAADRLATVGGVDGFNSFPGWSVRYELGNLWLSHIDLPGQELPENSLWQVREAELMTVDDYDLIMREGWPTFVERHVPKIFDMEEYAAAERWYEQGFAAALTRARDRGYPSVAVGGTTIPFEPLCGARSMRAFFADLHRRPQVLKRVMDEMLPHMIDLGVRSAAPEFSPGTWVGGWRSASGLLSPRIWDEFVFPYLHEIVHALHAQGIVSVLHLDHDWTRDLGRLRELPARSCVLNSDGMTDVRKAKELIGDHMAIMGDVPASLFAIGTPDAVYDYVRDLVRDLGPTGLLLCPGCDAPLNTKPENMEAFVAAAHEFGRGAA